MSLPTDTKNALFSRGEWPEAKRIADLLRLETIGGAMLLVAALMAIIWSNTPWDAAYFSLQDFEFGPSSLDLHLSMSHWASDGLLAIFFFTVGLELKHEFLRGDLRDPSKAVVPVIAAACGVVVPAVFYVLVQLISGGGAIDGWAIPTATDIAFAVAVLAVIGTHLPTALRSFLLTLAVVDDLIAITIIAIFFTSTINVWALVGSFAVVIVFGLLMRFGVRNPLILVPVGVIAWVLLHASGIHATIAGVLLGLSVPVAYDTAHNLEHRIRPLSAGFCVPVFAFFAAGVNFIDGFADAVTDPVTIGIVVGLICGKTVGIFGSTFVMARFTKAKLDDGIAWSDLFGMSLLAGIGFTVSLLIGELAFGPDSDTDQHVKIGVLVGSLLAALLATAVLRRRNKIYEAAWIEENRDDNQDGIPNVYEPAAPTEQP